MRHFLASLALIYFISLQAQDLPFKKEALSAPEFVQAGEKGAGSNTLPVGVFEKNGALMPLGTDLLCPLIPLYVQDKKK